MNSLWFRIIIGLFTAYIAFNSDFAMANKPKSDFGVHAKVAAVYVHAAIKAGREVYSKDVVAHLGMTASLQATESWEQDDILLLPAQFFRYQPSFPTEGGLE